AVDRDERSAEAAAQSVDLPRDHLLTRAAFAGNEDLRVGLGHPVDLQAEIGQRRTGTYKLGGAIKTHSLLFRLKTSGGESDRVCAIRLPWSGRTCSPAGRTRQRAPNSSDSHRNVLLSCSLNLESRRWQASGIPESVDKSLPNPGLPVFARCADPKKRGVWRLPP